MAASAPFPKIVLSFYGKVLESDDVAPYFADVDMKKLIDHQTKFICSLLGGPASFSDDQIRSRPTEAINVTDDAFNEIAALFVEALNEAELQTGRCRRHRQGFRSQALPDRAAVTIDGRTLRVRLSARAGDRCHAV